MSENSAAFRDWLSRIGRLLDSSFRFLQPHESHVDILSAAGLMAVEGEGVFAGFDRSGEGLCVERNDGVVRGVALRGCDELTVEIDLGVFVVVNGKSQVA